MHSPGIISALLVAVFTFEALSKTVKHRSEFRFTHRPKLSEGKGTRRPEYPTATKFLTNDDLAALQQNSNDTTVTRKKRQGMWPLNVYPDRTIYYRFDDNVPNSWANNFRAATLHWSRYSCVNFINSATHPNRVMVSDGGCNANIGFQPNGQIRLSDGCDSVYLAGHEIGHVLGLHHMQKRWDRDMYVSVNMAKVPERHYHDFTKLLAEHNHNYGLPYDYGGIMGYGGSDVAEDQHDKNQVYMHAKITDYQDTMGSPLHGFTEIMIVNYRYACHQLCDQGKTCHNGGIQSSRDCSKCLCPAGWGGHDCQARPDTCGFILEAGDDWASHEFGAGTDGHTNPDFATCHYFITAPRGKKVQIVMQTISSPFCGSGCKWGGVELKLVSDHRIAGVRSCCGRDANEERTWVSEGHLVPIITYSKHNRMKTKLAYRIVDADTPSSISTQHYQGFTHARYHGTRPTYT